MLLDSLRRDERRRRRRRLLFITLLFGGIAMMTVVTAFFAGWLTLATKAPTDAASNAPAVGTATAQPVDIQEWVTRLKGLHDHMHTAFGVGPDLTTKETGCGR